MPCRRGYAHLGVHRHRLQRVTPTAIMAIVLNLILPQTPVVAQHIDAAKDAAVDLVLPESKK